MINSFFVKLVSASAARSANPSGAFGPGTTAVPPSDLLIHRATLECYRGVLEHRTPSADFLPKVIGTASCRWSFQSWWPSCIFTSVIWAPLSQCLVLVNIFTVQTPRCNAHSCWMSLELCDILTSSFGGWSTATPAISFASCDDSLHSCWSAYRCQSGTTSGKFSSAHRSESGRYYHYGSLLRRKPAEIHIGTSSSIFKVCKRADNLNRHKHQRSSLNCELCLCAPQFIWWHLYFAHHHFYPVFHLGLFSDVTAKMGDGQCHSTWSLTPPCLDEFSGGLTSKARHDHYRLRGRQWFSARNGLVSTTDEQRISHLLRILFKHRYKQHLYCLLLPPLLRQKNVMTSARLTPAALALRLNPWLLQSCVNIIDYKYNIFPKIFTSSLHMPQMQTSHCWRSSGENLLSPQCSCTSS